MKSTPHFKRNALNFKRNALMLVLLLLACLMLLISCDAQNKGSGSLGPSPNETQGSSPSTSVLPTTAPTSVPPTDTSPPSLCPINPSLLSFTDIVGNAPQQAKEVTIANCGGPGQWTASIAPTDAASWLSSSPSNGWLDSGASQKVRIAVTGVAL